MLKELESEETVNVFVTFISLLAFQLGGGDFDETYDKHFSIIVQILKPVLDHFLEYFLIYELCFWQISPPLNKQIKICRKSFLESILVLKLVSEVLKI